MNLLVLLVLAAAPLAGGLRHPAAWSAAAALLWAAAATAPPARVPAWLLWLAWLGWTLLSAAASPEPLRSLGAAGETATALLLFSLCSRLDAAARRRWLIGLLAWGPLLAAAAALARWPGQAQWTGLLPPYYNYTACFEAAAVAAGAAVLCGRPGAWERRLAWAAALAGVAEITACGSRGAIVAALAGAGLALWRSGRRRAALAGLAAAVCLSTAAPFARRSWLKPEAAGANRRPSIWAAAVAVANDHPALGEGPGRFEQGFARHSFPSDVSTARYGLTSTHAHSEWLQAAAETGWIGLALLLAAWWATAAAALTRGAADGEPEGAREAAFAVAAAMTAQSLFDNVLALPWLRLVYASAAALACPAPRPASARANDGWLAACAAGLLLAAWGRWPGAIADGLRERAQAAPPAEASRALELARVLLPREPALLEAQARVALRRTPPDGPAAERALEAAYAASPYHAAYPQLLAEIASARRDWRAALERAREARTIEPEFLEARLVEAEALERLGHKRAAAEALERLEEARARLGARPAPMNAYDELIGYLDRRRLAAVRRAAR